MTPKHQQLVDAILLSMQRRISELVSKCQQPSGKREREQPIARLRESLLGGHLVAIAHYVEGYAYQGDVRVSADFIARCLYSDPLTPQRFRLPPKWQRSELGKLVHAAVLRFFEEERPGNLLTVTDMRKQFGVRRQTVHQWIDDGLIFAVYRGDTPLFYQKDVTRFQQIRDQKKR